MSGDLTGLCLYIYIFCNVFVVVENVFPLIGGAAVLTVTCCKFTEKAEPSSGSKLEPEKIS